jgi:transposase
MPLARRTARIWSGHHDLQSLQQMVAARALAAPVRADCSFWRCSSRTQPRQFACEGAPLGSRRKRGEWAQAVGRSRGGRTSKIHCLADDRGRPVAFALTPGNADISMAVPLLSVVMSPKHLIADKAYDADSLRNWLKTRRIKAVIPSTATRTVPYSLDRAVYRRRNLIERLFCRLKNWRRLGNTIRPLGPKLYRRARSRRDRYRVDLNESST